MAATLAASWASAQCPISVLPSRGCPPRELPSRGCLWELCAGPVLSRFSGVQLCVTPMDDSPPGSSVHGILHASILEWIAIPSSRGSSRPRDRTCISGLLHQQVGSLLLLVHRWDNEGPSTAFLATPTPEIPQGLLLTGPGSLAETLSCSVHC